MKTGITKYFSYIIITILILLSLSAILSPLENQLGITKKISLSELASQIQDGKIKQIIIKNNDLEITLKDNSKEKATKEAETGLTESLKNYGLAPEKLKDVSIEIQEGGWAAFVFGTLLPFLLPFLLIGAFLWFMLRQAQTNTMQAFNFIRSQARIASQKEKVTFADVAGLKEAKEELKEIVEFLKNPKKFLDIGARIPRGVLLFGPTGTGKTLLSRAVAGEANVPFYHISGSEFVELFVGVGASRVRDLFKTAKKNAPSIVFIDEIDAVGRQRGAGLGGGHDEREQTLNQILVEMDGFDRDTNVIVTAATNRPDILDPALLRPGRFDRRVMLDLPDLKDREEILKIHMKNKQSSEKIQLRQISERTPGFSGADLANLVNEAAILAARRNKKIVEQEELLESIEKILLGPERKSHILSKTEKEIAAYHEAGHAVVTTGLKASDPVHKVSIIARGRAAGYTLKLPIEDRHLHSQAEFEADIAVALGGYVAEKMIFHELTTGAADDLQKASELARRLITQYGMSKKFGPITFGDADSLVFLGKDISAEKNYSENTANEIDKEISKLIKNSEKIAKKILETKKDKLNLVAKKLIEKETIEKEEFELLVKN